MDDYFRGWRRKLGVVTLVMACVFAAGWVRGITQPLRIVIPIGGYIEYVVLTDSYSLNFTKDQQIWVGVRITPNRQLARISIPHWTIVTPLTLISAYLLLSGSRTPCQKIFIEPVPTGRA